MTKRLWKSVAWWPFGILWGVFFWPLLTLQSSFVRGDYMAQHLPWAWATFQAVRAGSLPFWTPLMGGGFPLLAEGQAAALYLPNWLAYRILPFLAAYTWSVPFHFAIGGIGMFLYTRKTGLSRSGAGWAAACFTFGSGYAGCFLNTASLRSACWIPLALWSLDCARRAPLGKALAIRMMFAGIVALQWTSGAAQMAVYTFGYYLVYEAIALWREFHLRSDAPFDGRPPLKCVDGLKVLAGLSLSLALGTWMTLMQIAPSVELIGQSVRQGGGSAFALWGSVFPPAPLLLFYPEWGNALRNCFYLGVGPLLFILLLLFLKRPKPTAIHASLAIIFFAIALGKFNPIYVWAVEHLHLTLLRNPGKFLLFSVTSLSVLAGCGLDAVVEAAKDPKLASKSKRWIAVLSGAVVFMPVIGQAMLASARPFWAAGRSWYVQRLIAEKGELAKDAAYYFGVMDRAYDGLSALFSYRNPLNLQTIAIALGMALLCQQFFSGRIKVRFFTAAASLLLVWDLFVFALNLGTGFFGNIGPVRAIEPSEWTRGLQAEAAKDSWVLGGSEPARVAELAAQPRDYQLTSNYQMYFGLAHAGGYSPLLIKRYHELIYDLGISDGSMGMPPVSQSVWKQQRGIVDLVGTRYSSTDVEMSLENFELLRRSDLDQAGERRLYRNAAAMPLLWAADRWDVVSEDSARLERLKRADFDPRQTALLDRRPNISAVPGGSPAKVLSIRPAASGAGWEASVQGPGLFVTRISKYPGWHLRIDGLAAELLTADHAFMAFWADSGVHQATLTYLPTGWNQWRAWTFMGWGAWALLAFAGTVLWRRQAYRKPTV